MRTKKCGSEQLITYRSIAQEVEFAACRLGVTPPIIIEQMLIVLTRMGEKVDPDDEIK